MRFLADMGVSLAVVRWLRAQGDDAIHLREQGLQRLTDPEIFEKSPAENRILLTFDLDFGEITALSGGREARVIVFCLREHSGRERDPAFVFGHPGLSRGAGTRSCRERRRDETPGPTSSDRTDLIEETVR